MTTNSNGRGTKVTKLPGGENLGQIDDLRFFTNKLFNSPSDSDEFRKQVGLGFKDIPAYNLPEWAKITWDKGIKFNRGIKGRKSIRIVDESNLTVTTRWSRKW